MTTPSPPRALNDVSIISPKMPLVMLPRASTTTISPGAQAMIACRWSSRSGEAAYSSPQWTSSRLGINCSVTAWPLTRLPGLKGVKPTRCTLRMPFFANVPAIVAVPISRNLSNTRCAARSNSATCFISPLPAIRIPCMQRDYSTFTLLHVGGSRHPSGSDSCRAS